MIFSWKSVLLGPLLFAQVYSQTYDYVVVGGGTAGLALAARLSEDNFASVAVIEAGTYYEVSNPVLSSTPATDVVFIGASPTDTNPAVDWNFVTAPQAGANNREIHYARGKCLGGSSARNFMIYQRADKGSLQQWADAVGDQSYTFDNMLPYYQKSCKFTPPGGGRLPNATTLYNPDAFNATGGPLQVSYPNYAAPFSTYIGPAFNEIGVPILKDFNSGSLIGSQWCSTTIEPTQGIRSSSQTSFLDAAASRSNLKVYSLTMAKQILFNANKKAVGVHIDNGQNIMASKEVIISAGAFQSPQLLMVSGIGPAATLKQFNIPVLSDLEGVGQNMTDHIFFGPSYEIAVQNFAEYISNPAALVANAVTQYLPSAKGPLSNNNVDYLAWEKTPRDLISKEAAAALSNLPGSWPEIEYLSSPGYIGNFQNLITGAPQNGKRYATILAALVAPQSRGNVTISSADAADLPIINPNWLSDPTDIQVAIAAFKRARAAFNSTSMAPALANQTEYFPGPAVQTDDQILSVIRNTLMTVWHAATTCRMGKAGDPGAVVDANAKVFGVTGLRVVDASSMALLPPGHPQSMIYAFAEKIADEIKNGK